MTNAKSTPQNPLPSYFDHNIHSLQHIPLGKDMSSTSQCPLSGQQGQTKQCPDTATQQPRPFNHYNVFQVPPAQRRTLSAHSLENINADSTEAEAAPDFAYTGIQDGPSPRTGPAQPVPAYLERRFIETAMRATTREENTPTLPDQPSFGVLVPLAPEQLQYPGQTALYYEQPLIQSNGQPPASYHTPPSLHYYGQPHAAYYTHLSTASSELAANTPSHPQTMSNSSTIPTNQLMHEAQPPRAYSPRETWS